MAKYIDPTYDIGFKLLFGREKVSEPILVDLLNALLSDRKDFEGITSVTYLNNERPAEWKDGKSIRYDILCETSSKHRFIVEMQKAGQPNFIDRATFYIARGIAEQGHRGKKEETQEWDYALKPVIGLFFCNFHVRGLGERPIVKTSTFDEETLEPIETKTRYIYVQLPFFQKKEDECTKLDEQWIYNIKNMGIRQEVAFKNNSEVFKRLAEVANLASLKPEERYHYEADLRIARDTINQIRGAYQDGEEKGFQKGRAEGKAEGIEIGETKERLASIRFMLSLGISPEVIANQYEMTPEEVIRLSNKHQS